MLLFNRWDVKDVKTGDPGLEKYINLDVVLVPLSSGKHGNLHKTKVSIVERFMNRLMVPGHRGKRHKITSGRNTGKKHIIYASTKEALEIIERKIKKNPVQVMVTAIENCALLEEVAGYRLGSIIARKSVTVSPKRRLDLALRYLTQGIYKKTFKNKRSLANTIADELIAAYNSDPKCFGISERNRMEREAEGAR